MKRLIALVTPLLFTLPSPVWSQTVDRVAAVVNNEIITTVQLQQELDKRRAGEVSPEERRQALEMLIEDTLVRQRVEELGLTVTDEELEAAIQDVQKQNKLNREQLIDALRLQGMDFEEYRENLRRQIVRLKLLGREVQSKVEVTGGEVRDYFREHLDAYREPPNLRLIRLTFPIPAKAGKEQIEAGRRLAEEALGRLRQGENFTSVLLLYSADHRAEGGDMGSFRAGELTAEFERAVTGLQEGELTGVIETPQGFHILQVTERNPGRVRQFDSAKDEITKILSERKSEEQMKKWAEGLKKKAHIDVRI